MVERFPPRYAPYLSRILLLAHEAERDADDSALISLIDEVLSQHGIAQYPEFQATVRLERAHALSTDAKGLNNEQARFVQSERAFLVITAGSGSAACLAGRRPGPR